MAKMVTMITMDQTIEEIIKNLKRFALNSKATEEEFNEWARLRSITITELEKAMYILHAFLKKDIELNNKYTSTGFDFNSSNRNLELGLNEEHLKVK